MAQPAAQFQARTLVRAQPMGSMRSFSQSVLAAGTLSADFEICSAVMDRNAFFVGASPSPTAINAVGPLLDAVCFSAQIAQLEVFFAVDDGMSFRSLDIFPVPANDLTQIAGMRITGRYVRVTYTNLGAVATTPEFGVYVRST